MLKQRKKQHGFTIVELLIVIVVIAIIAAISTVAYTGIQDRANAARAASIARNYSRLLEIYKLEEGDLPPGRNWHPVCLGPPDDYPENSMFAAGQCVSSDGAGHRVFEPFNDSLRSAGLDVPSGSTSTVSIASEPNGWRSNVNYRGVLFHHVYDWDEGRGTDAHIHYFVRGNHSCPQGEAHMYDGITECVITVKGNDTGDWGVSGGEGF